MSNLESPSVFSLLPSPPSQHSHSHSHSHSHQPQLSCQPAPLSFSSYNPFSALSNAETPVPEYAPLIEVEAEVLSGSKWVKTRCLVDSGAQGNLVDRSFSESNDLPAVSKPVPMSLTLADGGKSKSGKVTHFSPVTLKIGDHIETLALDKSNLGYPIILGLAWIKKHDCRVEFADHRLSFDSPYCRQHCLKGAASAYAPIHHPPRDSLVTPRYRIPRNPPPSTPRRHTSELGEEKTVQRDGSRKVLPPRNPSDVS